MSTIKRKVLGGLALIFLCFQAKLVTGQQLDSVSKALGMIATMPNPAVQVHVGEKIPLNVKVKMANNGRSDFRLADFHGKLIILDFWHQWCASCVELIPKFDSLQRQFGPDVMILPTTFQSLSSVNAFLSQEHHTGTGFGLPTIVEDTFYHRMFPCLGPPHEIWINGSGRVVAITDGEEVNEKNIAAYLHGQRLDLPDNSLKTSFKVDQPILQPDPMLLNQSEVFSQSMLCGWIHGVGTYPFTVKRSNGHQLVSLINLSVIDLYQDLYTRVDTAYANLYKKSPLATLPWIVVRDDGMALRRGTGNMRVDSLIYRLFSYQLLCAGNIQKSDLYPIVISDLDSHFGMQSRITTIMIPCLVLKAKKESTRISAMDTSHFEGRRNILHLKNVNGTKLLNILNVWIVSRLKELPLVQSDLSDGDSYNLELNLESSNSLEDIRKQLNLAGIDITMETKKVKALAFYISTKSLIYNYLPFK